ncbi:MAG: HAD hydrolase-like protein, partial [Candidatus Nanohaloarchaea archaeon]|nr:HAD hydrolase-like protein [Candidatus Nanohaloarchaea archaeon]
PDVIEAADRFRAEVIGKQPADEAELSDDSHFAANRERVAALTGITADMELPYRDVDGTFTTLTGEAYQNVVASDMFRTGMFVEARERGDDIYVDGVFDALEQMQETYTLAVLSTARTDIIAGIFSIVPPPVEFAHVVGQSPVLGRDKPELAEELAEEGDVACVIGDAMDDVRAGQAVGAETVFVTWGHATGDEEDAADHTVNRPDELPAVVKG